MLVKLQIWSRELTTPTLWPSGALVGVVSTRDQKLRDHVTWPRPFGKIFKGPVRTVPGNMHVKFALTVLEISAFNAQKLRGHVTLATPPFRNKFKRSCPHCP